MDVTFLPRCSKEIGEGLKSPVMALCLVISVLWMICYYLERQHVTEEVLRRFCRESEQKVNISESKLLSSNNVSASVGPSSLRLLVYMPITHNLGICLGIPLLL